MAVRTFELSAKSLSAEIRVFPRDTYMTDFYERAYSRNPHGQAFLYHPEPIWYRVPSDGLVDGGFKIRPTTKSSIGTDVPIFSPELWTIKHASLLDCIELVGTELKSPRLSANPERVATPCSFEIIANFLHEIDAASNLRLYFVQVSCLQFKSRTPMRISDGIIDAVMEFNKREFGSYPTKRLHKQHRAGYKELGIVSLGYEGREENA